MMRRGGKRHVDQLVNTTNIGGWRGKTYSPAEYFGHASVGHLQYAGYVAGPGTRMRELDDLLPGRVRQWAPVDVHPAQLVDAAVTGRRTTEQSRRALYHRSGRRRHIAVVGIVCGKKETKNKISVGVGIGSGYKRSAWELGSTHRPPPDLYVQSKN